MSFNDEYMVH